MRQPNPSLLHLLVIILPTVVTSINIIDRREDNEINFNYDIDSGCRDGTTEGFSDHPRIAACAGDWKGHISNSSAICAPGWRVCGWYDEYVLKTIKWREAVTVAGCFAFNAAQDRGRCQECTNNLEQDDLAAVGRGCPHQTLGQQSCISGGKIDASCCVDSRLNRACQYRPGVTGILCCKIPGIAPQIIVPPEPREHFVMGLSYTLTCQVSGMPPPRITWWKSNMQLPGNNTRIVKLSSGNLLIVEVQKSDIGTYTCIAKNTEGIVKASSKVYVTQHKSGCADGTTEGLHENRDIQACSGVWYGHVKRAKHLCAPGWLVCSPRYSHLLEQITWADTTNIEGCYAYNAENSYNKCNKRCHRYNMAGVGSSCARHKRHQTSCIAEGRVDVYRGRFFSGCSYRAGATTGVMCCHKSSRHKKVTTIPRTKKKKHQHSKLLNFFNTCSPSCQNGAHCLSYNRCQCEHGYKGHRCQLPICQPGCGPNAKCVKPGECQCNEGYNGPKCKRERHLTCKLPCYNGGRCLDGECQCPTSHWGPSCERLVTWRPLTEQNRTER
ncbi:unnamed protein product [Owenia fusiformis]|uniref:Uncharacterized protein n=1 Tax=Owenia fusiformis TaxID=6347 RepID=A0A8J1T5Z4_OWEFU|nr:unnamed protein product [Owenia fusiformis]